MGSKQGWEVPPLPPGPVHTEPARLTPVWVQLDALNVRVPGQPSHFVPDGLDMTGQVAGLLSGWHRTAKGDWLAIVNFSVPYADGRRHKLRISGQLVPAYALRPREGGPSAV